MLIASLTMKQDNSVSRHFKFERDNIIALKKRTRQH